MTSASKSSRTIHFRIAFSFIGLTKRAHSNVERVHAFDEKPPTERSFPDARDGHEERHKMRSKRRCQEVNKGDDYITRPADRQKYAQDPRQEGRSRNKISNRHALDSKKYHADGKHLRLKFESGQRHRL